MKELYEQMDFILSGGALKLLVDFLTPKVGSALILEPKDGDLQILDAIGTRTEGLILRGQASKLASAFSEHPLNGKFEVAHAAVEGDWPHAVRMRGAHWLLYILLRKKPDASLISELTPYAGIIHLWQTVQRTGATEERLSRLSYMVLATKSTLASIFEPLPLEYYAALVADVLRESLFPRAVSIFQDDGQVLSFFKGDKRAAPAREGLYLQKILPPTPIVTKKDTAPYEVVLPITEDSHRIFCVTEWDKLPTEETLNFMELLGSLASRALSISYLRTESTVEKNRVSSGDYTILSLSNALNALKQQKEYAQFLSLTADIFSEITHASDCFLVVWDEARGGYVPAVHRKKGIKASFDASLLAAPHIAKGNGESFFDLKKINAAQLFGALNLTAVCPWPEMNAMRYVFPFWNAGRLEGFIAVSSGTSPLADSSKLAALQIVLQFIAFELRRFTG